MSTRFDARVRTAAQLTADNPVIPNRYVMVESDTGKSKMGDGRTAWTSLSYLHLDSAAQIVAALGGPIEVAEVGADAADLWTALEALGLIAEPA